MIKFYINEKCDTELEAIGNFVTLSTDTCMLIKRLYDSLKEGPGAEVAEAYRNTLIRCLTDKESPLFEEVVKNGQ